MSVLDTLITNRTQQDVDELISLLRSGVNPSNHKGAYNAADLNRVGNAVEILCQELSTCGINLELDSQSEYALPNKEIKISYRQDGSGTPSMTNVRMIYPGLDISGIGPIYGGLLNVPNRNIMIQHEAIVFDGTETWQVVYSFDGVYYRYVDNRYIGYKAGEQIERLIQETNCSHFEKVDVYNTGSVGYSFTAYTIDIRPDYNIISNLDDWKMWLRQQAENDTPLTIVMKIVPILQNLSGQQMDEVAEQIGLRIEPIKTDWTERDIPTQAHMEKYLGNLQSISDAVKMYRPDLQIPATMKNLDYNGANQIEKLLEQTNIAINRIKQSYRMFSGRHVSGVNCLP